MVIDEDKDSDMKISDQRDKRGSNLNLNTPISNYKNSKGRALYKQHSCYDNTISKSPDFDQWVEDNRDKIASAIIKTIRNKTVSRYKCLRIKGVPFYKSF